MSIEKVDESLAERSHALCPGTILAERYRVIRALGEGGMSEVYLCEVPTDGTPIVVKLLAEELLQTEESLLRFQREARILETLRHPNIVRLYEFATTETGQPFLAMEYVDGTPLSAQLEPHVPLGRFQTLDIVRQVASALGAAHDMGVVHRDLKPENIIVVSDKAGRYEVKLIDFGIALSPGSRITAQEVLLGTPHFMSPEQAAGDRDAIDPRSDQFSLAALCYLLLSGHLPFGGGRMLSVLFRVVNDEPEPLPPHLGTAVKEVIFRALSKSRAERFASIAEFADAFEQALMHDQAPAPEAFVGELPTLELKRQDRPQAPSADVAPMHDEARRAPDAVSDALMSGAPTLPDLSLPPGAAAASPHLNVKTKRLRRGRGWPYALKWLFGVR